MPLTPAVRQRCKEFLPADAEVQYLFPATSASRAAAHGPCAFGAAPFVVAITRTDVTVLGCGWFSRRPTSVLARFPREITLGRSDRVPTIAVGDLVMEIAEEYLPLLRAADAELSAQDDWAYLPPDPLPHL
jgi:hypothetical protein